MALPASYEVDAEAGGVAPARKISRKIPAVTFAVVIAMVVCTAMLASPDTKASSTGACWHISYAQR
jgi:hypothetical protein